SSGCDPNTNISNFIPLFIYDYNDVPGHYTGNLLVCATFFRACSISDIRSSGSSNPTENRIKPSAMPCLLRSSALNREWEVNVGVSSVVSTPAKLIEGFVMRRDF